MKRILSFLLIFFILFQFLCFEVVAEDKVPIKKIIGADSRSFFITSEGHLMASGSNKDGILGLGNSILYTNKIVDVPYLTGVIDVAAGKDETYFLLENGDVYTSGIGILTTNTPTKITSISNVRKIAVNNNSVIFLKNTGELYIYGDNTSGQLGAGSVQQVTSITKLSGVSNVKDVQMGDKFTVVLFEDGTVKSTGYDNGRLGLGNTTSKIVTNLTSLLNNTSAISKIAVGKTHVLYLADDNALYATADNGMSVGLSNSKINKITKLSDFESKVVDIGASEGSFVLLENGSVWSVGNNSYGADFSGTTVSNNTGFKKVANNVTNMFIGFNQTFLNMENAEIWTAGKNNDGELALGTSGGNILIPAAINDIYSIYGEQQTLEVEDSIKDGVLYFNHAVLVNKSITLQGSASIEGSAATNKGAVVMTGATKITGNLYIGEYSDIVINNSSDIVGEEITLNKTFNIPIPEFLETPTDLEVKGGLDIGPWPQQTYTINDNGCYEYINLTSNGTLTINVGANERILHVKNLNISQGTIKLIGTGKLYLFVDGPFDIKGSSTFNSTGVITQLDIIVGGTGTVSLLGNSNITGSIYGKNINLSISGSSKLIGNAVIGGKTVLLSGSTPLKGGLYSPNADVSLSGSSYIEGALIANSYIGIGSTKVIYQEISFEMPIKEEIPEEVIEEPIEPSQTPKIPEYIDKSLKDLDYELIISVAKDGDKKLGASLEAYKDMLAVVDNSNNNESLKRVTKLANIFGEDFIHFFKYGTYDFYNE